MEGLNGPDQILESSTYITTDRASSVKLRLEEDETGLEPISVPSLLKSVATDCPDNVALAAKCPTTQEWMTWTYAQYYQDSRTVAKAFIKLGLRPRHTVAILSVNCPQWLLATMGATFANGMACGIYLTSSPESISFIIRDSGADILVVENAEYLATVQELAKENPGLKAVIQISGEIEEALPNLPTLTWSAMMDLGALQPEDELNDRLARVAINQCCLLVYTSGTTGNPKGVMLSHDNLTFGALVHNKTFHLQPAKLNRLQGRQMSAVSYLPLSHVAAMTIDLFMVISSGATLYFAEKDALKGSLIKTLRETRPTMFFGPPRVWEKFLEALVPMVTEAASGSDIPINQALPKEATDKMKAALGLDRCIRFYSAAAPISRKVLEFFAKVDIEIWELYGMSETGGPHTANCGRPGGYRLGTSGRPFIGTKAKLVRVESEREPSIRINEDSLPGTPTEEEADTELRMRGRNIMMGYLGNEAKTREVFDEYEWLRSGDLATVDEGGFVTIVGRLKELLVTAGGKNVPPVPIEMRIKKTLAVVSNAVVIGEGKKFLSCLLTLKLMPDQETLQPEALAWCQGQGIPATTAREALSHPDFEAAIQSGIDLANKGAESNPKQVRKWRVVLGDFSVAGGELGPTLKLKRHVVAEKYKDVIQEIYEC